MWRQGTLASASAFLLTISSSALTGLHRLMISGSVVIKHTIFPEWHHVRRSTRHLLSQSELTYPISVGLDDALGALHCESSVK